jgi:hypothetical protein
MSGFVSVVLMPVQYLLIAGFGVLAVVYYRQLNLPAPAGVVDFERILPSAMLQFAPAGIICAIIAPALHRFFLAISQDIFPLYCFPIILFISGLCCIGVCLRTAPVDDATLINFLSPCAPLGNLGPRVGHSASARAEFYRQP